MNLDISNVAYSFIIRQTQVPPKQRAKIIPRTNGGQCENVRGQFRNTMISFRKEIATHIIYLSLTEHGSLCWFKATLTSYRSLTSIQKISPNQVKLKGILTEKQFKFKSLPCGYPKVFNFGFKSPGVRFVYPFNS